MAQHYFASCPFGFATAPSRIEAIDKLINHFRTDLQTLTKNAQKDGLPGGYVWTCRVVGQEVKDYGVSWFQPVVKDLDGVTVDRPKEHYITYLTKTKRSVFDLTAEVQRQVDRQQKLVAEEDAA